jgi:stearoyl-CoA desaturase (delta-9 desaturase)
MTAAEREAPSARSGFDASVGLPLLGVHLLGLGLAPFTFTWPGLWACAALYLVTGLGVTAGAHRLFTHQSFTPRPLLREALALSFLLAAQGSVARWVRDHHLHHRFADRDGDPHSPVVGSGFVHAHLGWLWQQPPSRAETTRLYLKWTRRLDAGVLGRALASGPALAALHAGFALGVFGAGALWGGPRLGLSLLVWGVLLRIVLVMHSTFLVNSAAHLWGARRYDTRDRSRNSAVVALLALGEGWHNNHHHRAAAANNGFHRWWELDLTFAVLVALGAVGLLRDLRVWHAREERMVIWFPST